VVGFIKRAVDGGFYFFPVYLGGCEVIVFLATGGVKMDKKREGPHDSENVSFESGQLKPNWKETGDWTETDGWKETGVRKETSNREGWLWVIGVFLVLGTIAGLSMSGSFDGCGDSSSSSYEPSSSSSSSARERCEAAKRDLVRNCQTSKTRRELDNCVAFSSAALVMNEDCRAAGMVSE